MTFKKSICLVGSILATSTAFAAENNTEASSSKINLDVLGGIGYTHYDNIKDDDKDNSLSTSGNGFNVNASALYSILETKIGSPVVGLGLNYGRTTGSENRNYYGENVDINSTFSTLAVVANGGFKFTPAPKFAIFTLANLGYGVYNNYKADLKDQSGNSATINTSLKDHYLYGVSVIGTYEVVQNFSVGVGLTYNRHSFKIDNATIESEGQELTRKINSTNSFNEYSANLTAAYSL